MCGAHNGVATKLLQEESRALYTHCYAHTLNLAVADTIKKSKLCRDALDTAFEVTHLIKFSPKRNTALRRFILVTRKTHLPQLVSVLSARLAGPFIVMLATIVVSKHSFSTMRRIKSYLRSIMR